MTVYKKKNGLEDVQLCFDLLNAAYFSSFVIISTNTLILEVETTAEYQIGKKLWQT